MVMAYTVHEFIEESPLLKSLHRQLRQKLCKLDYNFEFPVYIGVLPVSELEKLDEGRRVLAVLQGSTEVVVKEDKFGKYMYVKAVNYDWFSALLTVMFYARAFLAYGEVLNHSEHDRIKIRDLVVFEMRGRRGYVMHIHYSDKLGKLGGSETFDIIIGGV